MTKMGNTELKQIEQDIADLHLEEYPITAVQLKSIIDRLRRAERAAETMAPYMRYYTDRDRLKRANEAWTFPRLGAILTAMLTGMIAVGVSGLVERLLVEPMWPVAGFVALTFIAPFLLVFFVLFKAIDKTMNRRLMLGFYDAKEDAKVDYKLLRHEQQVSSFVRFYGRAKN